MNENPKSGFERYDELLENKRRKAKKQEQVESLIVPAVLKLLAWICLVIGVAAFFVSSWQYGLATIVGAVFLFGFAAIVKAAYKYLDE